MTIFGDLCINWIFTNYFSYLSLNDLYICSFCSKIEIRTINEQIKKHCPQLKETYKFGGRHFVAPFLYSLKYRFTQKMLKLWTVIEKAIKSSVLNIIYEESKRSGMPVLCVIDDTIASKTKLSSKAENPIEDAYFHFSHLKKKQDYGHQAIGVMLSCNGITLNYAILMYDKSVSKIDIVCKIAAELPIPPVVSYLLCDSWYSKRH